MRVNNKLLLCNISEPVLVLFFKFNMEFALFVPKMWISKDHGGEGGRVEGTPPYLRLHHMLGFYCSMCRGM